MGCFNWGIGWGQTCVDYLDLCFSKNDCRVSDIASVVAHENDAAKALYFWTAWRDTLGPKMVEAYSRLIRLINKGKFLVVELSSFLLHFS